MTLQTDVKKKQILVSDCVVGIPKVYINNATEDKRHKSLQAELVRASVNNSVQSTSMSPSNASFKPLEKI